MPHLRRTRVRARSLVVAAVLSLLVLLPAGAFASSASTRIKRVFYTAAPAEVNTLQISLAGADYELVDQGATIAGEPACSAFGSVATCDGDGIIGITVNTGDEADIVTNATSTPATLSGGDGNDSLEGGAGDDVLRGNQGVDTHAGGAGDDFIDVRGDRGDVVGCGEGNDIVRADFADSVALDCETVDRSGVPPPSGPTAGPSPAAGALLGPSETRELVPGACARERIGTPRRDRLAGTLLGDSLFGMQGNDVLRGLAGDDCLFGGVGSDRLSGASGNDRLLGDDSRRGRGGNDRLSGHTGDDVLAGGPGDDRLKGGRGRDRLLGGFGNDRLNGLNGGADRLSCGPGRDLALADRSDRVRGCERVLRRR